MEVLNAFPSTAYMQENKMQFPTTEELRVQGTIQNVFRTKIKKLGFY